MTQRATFEVRDKCNGDTEGDQCTKTQSKVFECSLLQICLIGLFFSVITSSVGLMIYYLPDRPEVKVTKSPTGVSELATTNYINESSETTTQTTIDPMLTGRLPRNVLPRRYLLNIRPYLYDSDAQYSTLNNTSTFDGWVQIQVECIIPTDEIVLHVDNTLVLHGFPSVIGLDNGESRDLFDHYTLNTDLLFLVLRLKDFLEPNRHYEIRISFSGWMDDEPRGLYVSRYYSNDTELRLTAATQMQGAYARRVLPCFDEPPFKASFDVQIEHRHNMTAMSNGMETDTIQLDGHWSRTYFKRVAAMATYLLAIVVHDFQNISRTTEDGCRVRIWMQPNDISYASNALDDATKLQQFFNSILDIKYPLEKLDHIGIAYMQGAMENWGLITYDDNLLKNHDDLTITHEIVHQWFGNLVTLEWWDDLWLNEGFASYFQHIGVDYLDQSQNQYEDFYQVTMAAALNIDIKYIVATPLKPFVSYDVDDIQNQLVPFTYNKGGSIIFMMKHFLADGVFEKGIRNYLKERSYRNVNIDHLWHELTYADQDVGNHDMKKIMDSWTLQPGAPIVTFNRTANTLVLHQTRMYIGFPSVPEPLSGRYFIPLSYVHQTHPSKPKQIIMDPMNEETVIHLDDASESDWYLANFMQTGYYYANYDLQNWQRIVDQAQRDPNVFTYQNQIGLLRQTRDMMSAQMIPAEIYRSLVEAFRDTSLGTRKDALIADMNDLKALQGRGATDALQTRIREEVNNLYRQTGWSTTSKESPLVFRENPSNDRLDLMSLACVYGNSECVSQAIKLYSGIMVSPHTNSVNPVFRSLVYCNGVRYGGYAEWVFAVRQMQVNVNYLEKTRWATALTCTSNSSALTRYAATLGDSLSDFDVLRVVVALANNPQGRELAWSYVMNYWDQLYSSGMLDINSASDVLSAVTDTFNTEDKLQELLTFGQSRVFGRLQFAYDMAVTQVYLNVIHPHI